MNLDIIKKIRNKTNILERKMIKDSILEKHKTLQEQ